MTDPQEHKNNPKTENTNFLLQRLPEDKQKELVQLVKTYYRGCLSENKRTQVRVDLLGLLGHFRVADIIISLKKIQSLCSGEYSKFWERNSGESITDAENHSSVRNDYPYYDNLYEIYTTAVMDCITTVDTADGKKKIRTNYTENFKIEYCIDKDDETTANYFLTHFCRVYYFAVRTELTKRLRKHAKIKIVSFPDTLRWNNSEEYDACLSADLFAAEEDDFMETDPDRDDDEAPELSDGELRLDSDLLPEDYSPACRLLDRYFGDLMTTVVKFSEKHRKMRTEVSLERLFFTEEVVRFLKTVDRELLRAGRKGFRSEKKIMQTILRNFLDFLMSKPDLRTYLGIAGTRLKTWAQIFGDEPFARISEEKWQKPIPLREKSKETGEIVSRLDYRIYSKYFEETGQKKVVSSRISEYHASFNEILQECKQAFGKTL